jgi:HEAT repeat protein
LEIQTIYIESLMVMHMGKCDNIIEFPDPEQALQLVNAWLEGPGEPAWINDQTVLLIRRAFRLAPSAMRIRMLLMLGVSRRPSAADTLYTIMIDSDYNDEVRRFAAVQLCSLGPGLEIETLLVAHLTEELNSPQPQRRANAAIALGWEGHLDCVLDLLKVLYDPDPEVQEAAAEALTNLGDARIVAPFIERLQTAPVAQQKVILYNLERFAGADGGVKATYLNYLSHPNPELRLDALSLLTRVSSIDEHMEVCAACLGDTEFAVRALALDHLYHQAPGTIATLDPQIEALTKDPYPEIRKRARALLSAIHSAAQEG